MVSGLLGRKLGMTRVFDEDGKSIPVTVIEAGPCIVVQVKTEKVDNYNAVQLGFCEKRENLCKKPEYYHYLSLKCKPTYFLKEFRSSKDSKLKSGDTVKVNIFSSGDKVIITGVSKGKGFQGVVKRWGFKGGKATHGAETHRRPGSIGQCADPSRVFKKRKMPGRMGHDQVTVKNLKVIDIDTDKNIMCVRGAVPGHRGSLLRIMRKEDSSNV